MTTTQTDTHALSIGRHVAQFILRSAMLADPSPCHGLIASSPQDLKKNHIAHAELLSKQTSATLSSQGLDESDTHHTLQTWQDQGVLCCGTFTSSPPLTTPDAKDLKALEATLHAQLHGRQPSQWFHLFVCLNTKGCLETFAYQLKDGLCVAIPLLLNEDGQQITSS